MIVKTVTQQSELESAFQIRTEIFIKEQNVPDSDEFDQFDILSDACIHVLAYYDGKPVGTGRVRFVNNTAKLERICILKSYRKYKLGTAIVQHLEAVAKENGVASFILHGQTHAESFYTRLGYQPSSDVFIEDGIPHIEMKKRIR